MYINPGRHLKSLKQVLRGAWYRKHVDYFKISNFPYNSVPSLSVMVKASSSIMSLRHGRHDSYWRWRSWNQTFSRRGKRRFSVMLLASVCKMVGSLCWPVWLLGNIFLRYVKGVLNYGYFVKTKGLNPYIVTSILIGLVISIINHCSLHQEKWDLLPTKLHRFWFGWEYQWLFHHRLLF